MKNFKKIFTKVFDENIEKIFRFIFLKVNSREVAEDLAQQVFLKLWEKISEIENPKAFLYKVARDLTIDYYRKEKKVTTVSIDDLPISDARVNIEREVIVNSEIDLIKNALRSLPENYQNVIILHYLNDLSIKEISKILNKSENATRVLISRALSLLKEKLNPKSNLS